MDSGSIGDSNGDLNSRGRVHEAVGYKVYTRRSHRKALKTSNNNDTATTSTSAAENPTPTAAAASTTTSKNPSTTAASTNNVPSAPVATTATTQVSPSTTYEDPNDSAAVSCQPTLNGSLAPNSASNGNEKEGEHLVKSVDLDFQVPNGADSSYQTQLEQSPPQEQSLPDRSAEPDEDYPCKEQQHLHHTSVSQPEDDSSTQNRAQQGSGDRATEHRNSLPNSNEVQNLESWSPHHNKTELSQRSVGEQEQNVRESSPLSHENDLLVDRNVTAGQLPTGIEPENGESILAPPQISSCNGAENNVNGVVKPLVTTWLDDKVKFNICKETPVNEIEELRKKLEFELEQVRRLAEQLEAKELQLALYNAPVSHSHLGTRSYTGSESRSTGDYNNHQSQHALDVVENRPFIRMNPDVGLGGHQESRPTGLARMNSDVGAVRNLEHRSYNRQLSVAVMENTYRDAEFVEREKRTPKANQYYRKSEFLLAKDRLPPESNKRLKANNGRKHSVDAFGLGFGFDKSRNQVFKSCSSLLQKLMKHKHGWVFNEPVNAQALGLVDYHDIIKHPMDLGTIKTNLSQNRYKSPRDFAEDVRLVFRNAMTYNPKGQDVHVMAEQLSQLFEEKWAGIETEYNPYWKYQMYQDTGLPTPTSRKGSRQSHFVLTSVPVSVPGYVPAFMQAHVPAPTTGSIPLYAPADPQMSALDRQETMSAPMSVDPKFQRPHIVRTPVPKKPKAKDPNKRDMTYEEKQKLSTNLQGLPTEKLDAIVQIIKRRNTALSQHDDEIEVDIDNVDTETLWELDRFVTNYKKSLSKYKRKAELALQARMASQTITQSNTNPTVADQQIESGAEAIKTSTAPPSLDPEKQGNNGSRSSSSSSSSSDSGSSSSDSDSDSSSAEGSDAGHSPDT